MSGIRRCKHKNKGIDFCVNHCPYADEGDCIDGQPVVAEVSSEEQAKMIVNQKYENNRTVDRRAQHKEYRKKNKEKVYSWNRDYAERHPDVKQRISRKYARLKILKSGNAKIVGSAMIRGKETIIYKGKKKNDFWFLWGQEYGEISTDELDWLWIEKRCI